jgi:acetyl-CoA carboxylase biotin carboxylase subunit
VRFDTMLYSGYAIPPFYDSLLGKLIVWGDTREHAIDRLKGALSELDVPGVKTTVPLYTALAGDADVRANAVHTRWLEQWLESNAKQL